MEVTVSEEDCIGCGTCVGLCGEVFELGNDGKAHIVEEYRGESPFVGTVPDDMECLEPAAENCPTDAITVE